MADPKKRKRGAPQSPRGPREIIIGFKGYPEFKGWVLKLSEQMRLPVSVLLEHALLEYARNHDFQDEPPKR